MDMWYLYTALWVIVAYFMGGFFQAKHNPARERLDRIKALMREQNERVVARDPDHQPLDYASLWVDIWVEVAPHRD